MTSVVTVCNMALGNIGITQTIENIEDNNERARMCKLYYEPLRDQIVRNMMPNFSRAVVALSPVTGDPPPGWGFQYRYPTDCLMAKQVSDAAGIRQLISTPFISWDTSSSVLAQPKVPFEILADPTTTGRIIVTDQEEAYLWYAKRVTDPNQFDSEFVFAFAWALAASIAVPLKANPQIAQYATNMARSQVGEASVGTKTEQQMQDERVSPSISGRS